MSDIKAKKPKSNFLLFCEEKRAHLKSSQPELKSTQVVQECSRLWRELPESEKEVYTKKYQGLKDQLALDAPKKEKPKSTKTSSAYINFCVTVRERVKAANPGINPKDLMRKVAAEWSSLNDEGKAAYKPKCNDLCAQLEAVKIAAPVEVKPAPVEEKKAEVPEPVAAPAKRGRKARKVEKEPVLQE